MSKQPGPASASGARRRRKGRTAAAAKTAARDRQHCVDHRRAVIVVGGALVFVFAGGSTRRTASATSRVGRPRPGLARLEGDRRASRTCSTRSVRARHRPSEEAARDRRSSPRTASPDRLPGREYCPFCAAERWGMVNALSRLRDLHNLQIIIFGDFGAREAAADYPQRALSTARPYKSAYIPFEPVEAAGQPTRICSPLPTTEQQQLEIGVRRSAVRRPAPAARSLHRLRQPYLARVPLRRRRHWRASRTTEIAARSRIRRPTSARVCTARPTS